MVGDETVATGIRNGTKTVVEGGVSLHVRFSFSHIVHNIWRSGPYVPTYVSCRSGVCEQKNAFCTYLKEGGREEKSRYWRYFWQFSARVPLSSITGAGGTPGS